MATQGLQNHPTVTMFTVFTFCQLFFFQIFPTQCPKSYPSLLHKTWTLSIVEHIGPYVSQGERAQGAPGFAFVWPGAGEPHTIGHYKLPRGGVLWEFCRLCCCVGELAALGSAKTLLVAICDTLHITFSLTGGSPPKATALCGLAEAWRRLAWWTHPVYGRSSCG